jgi:hypothetical protein
MTKTVTPSQAEYPTPPAYSDQNALVAALKDLTASIYARRDVREPSTEAKNAGIRYGEIKRALRRYFEPSPAAGTSTPSRSTRSTNEYE